MIRRAADVLHNGPANAVEYMSRVDMYRDVWSHRVFGVRRLVLASVQNQYSMSSSTELCSPGVDSLVQYDECTGDNLNGACSMISDQGTKNR